MSIAGASLQRDIGLVFEYYDYYGYNSKNQTAYYIKKEDIRYNDYICEDAESIVTDPKVFTVGQFSREKILKVEGREIIINRAVAEKYGIVIEEMKEE